MELKVKFLEWYADVPVAMLNQKTAERIGVHIKDRIFLKSNSHEMSTIVNTVDKWVKEDEIAVSNKIKKRLNLKKGQKIDAVLAMPPKSLSFIKKKLNNGRLSKKEIEEIIGDIVNNSLSESEIAMFVSAMYKYGLNMNETIFLIEAILKTGELLNLKKKFIADKHSIGGVPGRTTPIVVSICASAGLIFPKTSSRAITTPAGTADVIETIARVDFSMKELRKIIQKTGACMVWGGGLEMVPADSIIIQIEKVLNIDPESQMLASIMAKKLAVGSNYILIHIPYGRTAKVNRQKAVALKKKFEKLGKYFNKKLKCNINKNNGPVGKGVGPVLEMIDVIKILDPNQKGPKLLEKRALILSAELLEMTGKAKKGEGLKMALDILYSGKAFEKFKQIIKAQEGDLDFKKLQPAKLKKDFYSAKSGRISEIDNKKINLLARIVGCPSDKRAGVYLHFNAGEKVRKGEKIITIYSENRSRLKQASKFYEENKIIKINN
ncbi:MAG: thymidine phosphorylase [archaeon]